MAKKKKVMMFVPGAIACVLGIAAFCMMFLDAVTYTGKLLGSTASVKGMLVAFGGKTEDGLFSLVTSVKNFEFKFNIMTTLGFGLPLIGGVLALIFKNGLITKIVTTACFVVGAVFLFSTVGFMSISLDENVKTVIDGVYTAKLAAGPIVGGVLAIIGAAVCFFKGTIAKALSR